MCQVDQRVRLSGGAKICEMTISGVVPEDAGAYRCVLADREDIVTVARNINIYLLGWLLWLAEWMLRELCLLKLIRK